MAVKLTGARGYELISILLGVIGLAALWSGAVRPYWPYWRGGGAEPALQLDNTLLAVAGAVALIISAWLLLSTLRGRRGAK